MEEPQSSPPRLVIGLDPGDRESGLATYDGKIVEAWVLPNAEVRARLRHNFHGRWLLAIEMIVSYGGFTGMAARNVILTSVEIGRFMQIWEDGGQPAKLIPRLAVKQHLCGTAKAKDPDVRLACLDRFGGPGCEKKGGPLYAVKSHAWSALAVALTAWDEAKAPEVA